jgi:hypothetical protein
MVKQNIWNSGKKVLREELKDTDKDGVINLFDCRRYNKRKQGEQHQGAFL